MKTNFKQIMFSVAISASVLSCTSVDFGDTNIDPNASTKASAPGLLTTAMVAIADSNKNTDVDRPSGVLVNSTAMLYSQYISNGQYPQESRYETLNWSYGDIYTRPLNSLNEVIKTTKGSGVLNESNIIAVATLVRAYFLHGATDRWGDIPYSEALLGVENKTPKLDSQEDVYKGLFNEIDGALASINMANAGPKGDIIFNGDMNRWKKFGNTLKVVMALRLSKRNSDLAGLAKTKFNEAIGGAISSSSENIFYQYLKDDSNDNPFQDQFGDEGRVDWIMSDVLVNYMIGSGSTSAPQDPRLAKYAEPVGTDFIGAPYGDANTAVADFSQMSTSITTVKDYQAMMFTAAQINFSKAEAVELGWMSGDAKNYFEAGIKESMTQWGVSSTDADAFVASVTYAGIQSIAEQKWVALYMQGYESWAEWRRIGGPATIVKPATQLQGTDIPQRQAYATSVANNNTDNHTATVASQGPDNLDTKLWWAK
ncbi:SusD/RagB family nutrient-binding outer membrane lipoprotein [Tenacibaculum finnmarkense]|uniref:SusD/RagB family nutrient-binding outer membrane lipoprotein n=1 Tax=Tenacibaculum finnmarkense TaxID=2781243 RepID=UPI001EFB15C8|nr:SusD/RagB family nutrient-binding outer membrane lipoprotein [Tenacibaculum finnmarkense]MCG8732788.1 SusD/RagB family nutrient-binding outer membrane lipoprotein [Tenacibaculum finnmarkense]